MRENINELKIKLERDKMLNRLSDLNKYLVKYPDDNEVIAERNEIIHKLEEN